MTLAEIRAMLARVDARQLRLDAGIRVVTVARALGVLPHVVYKWEQGRGAPRCPAAFRWSRVIAGLERHAEVTAELYGMDEAA